MFHFQVGHNKTPVSHRPLLIAVYVVVGGVVTLISIVLIVRWLRARKCHKQEDGRLVENTSTSHDRAQGDSGQSDTPMSNFGPERPNQDRTQDDSGQSNTPMSNFGPERPNQDRTQDDSGH